MPTRFLLFIAFLVVAGWLAWPYFTLWSFGKAVDSGDPARIEDRVDWESVRSHLKEDVKRRLQKELGPETDGRDGAGENLARGAIMLLGAVVAEGLVDTYATPKGLMAVLREIAKAGEGKDRFRDTVSYAFFASPASFEVHVRPKGSDRDNGNPLVLTYGLQDFNWIVTRIELPLDALEEEPQQEGSPKDDQE